MNETLYITLIQSHLAWENPIQNRRIFEQKINSIVGEVDIIVLPEMFTTGFTMNASEMFETMEGLTVSWMKKMAVSKGCAICGSIIIKEASSFYNRFLFVDEKGDVISYDKHQLFALAKEHTVFSGGNQEVLIDYKGWKIKPQICYDLRFPVWARNTSGYDILLYVASWPKPRIRAWDILLQARAIENMCYCIGVNRVGLDGKGYEYNGHSGVYDVLGNAVSAKDPTEKEAILQVVLTKSHIHDIRAKLPFLDDADKFTILH